MISVRSRNRSIVAAVAALVLPAALLAAPERLHAGQWEFSTSHVEGEPESVKTCVTAEEAASINGGAQTGRAYAERNAGAGCKVNDYSVNGDVVTYSVTCGKSTVRATVTYRGDTSEGDTVIQREGQPDIVMHVKARRIGECPRGEALKP
jgi:Protein of unknown function (DUF3617)